MHHPQAHAIDTTGNGVYDAVAIDTDADGILDTAIAISPVEYTNEFLIEPDSRGADNPIQAPLLSSRRKQQRESRQRLRRAGADAFIGAVIFIFGVTSTLSVLVAWCEEWDTARGVHIIVNAVFSNGNGKHVVKHPLSRILLAAASLLGFFCFVEWFVRMIPVLTRLELLPPQRSITLAPIHSARRAGSNSTTSSSDDVPWASAFWVRGEKRRRGRLKRCLWLWVTLMSVMFCSYYYDHMTGNTESFFAQGTMALLYAVTTGCSGGFGSISNDWLDAFFIAMAVPLTAWLAAELSVVSTAWELNATTKRPHKVVKLSNASKLTKSQSDTAAVFSL